MQKPQILQPQDEHNHLQEPQHLLNIPKSLSLENFIKESMFTPPTTATNNKNNNPANPISAELET